MIRPLRHSAPLDGLRAVAALCVLAFHVDATRVPGGFLGIDLFFVLSGYLITRLLLEQLEQDGRFDAVRFYVRRAVRLYPALLLGTALAFGCGLALHRPPGHLLVSSLYATTYVSDLVTLWSGSLGLLGHTWSLAIEEQFYLLWPVLLLVLARKGIVRVGAVLLALAFTGVTVWVRTAAGADAYFLPSSHAAELLVGCWLADLLARSEAPPRLTRPAVVVVVAFACAVLTVPGPSWVGLYRGGWLLLAVLTAVVITAVTSEPASLLARVLGSRPAVWLGKRSYGLYLYSAPLAVALKSSGQRFAVTAAATVVLSVVAAALSYAWVEAPLLRRAPRQPRKSVTSTDRLP